MESIPTAIASLALSSLSLAIVLVYHVAHAAEMSHQHVDLWTQTCGYVTDWVGSFLEQGPQALKGVDLLLFVIIIMVGLEGLDFLAKNWGLWFNAKGVPVRGKHLDDFSLQDKVFVAFSKANSGPFTYFYFRYVFEAKDSSIVWKFSDLSVINTVGALLVLFVVFDFFYTILHWFLHLKFVYSYIHKHHHTQKAPSRAAVDAINVHPIEYLLGEYNHLWALFLVTKVLHFPVHAATTLALLLIGGFLAGVNHTRYDVTLSIFGVTLFDSKAHDVHHRIPQSNYGQYSMFWDVIFGTFRPYNDSDRINPNSQLDPRTGKSLSHAQQQRAKSA